MNAHPPVTLLTGDAATVLATLPTESVDCIVTSPPYWRLRDYTTGRRRADQQLGAEPTPHAYVDALVSVFSAAKRVLTPTGTLRINLGDSYSTNSDGYLCGCGQRGQPRYRPRGDLPHKNLLGMPWRVALALQTDGWILRSAIVWHKPNAAPTPVRDRLACRHEMIFLLVRAASLAPDGRSHNPSAIASCGTC